ncbi:sulfite exporter TauE/SafE family protein [Vreelandella populi]|uniref:Probable membrane transporter protein n=2 Tax=Vreelandella populi TaxID=2498858 RepID=A0A3S0WZN4_9GAMM|nr:sulfite exporter TauE/SafE family protein [Halomonas populi]RUR38609.1 sulfite exporter TauE/SafE family protein [Halomonas populi]RUR43567.1 sulfite exporter TauE/SafE family protein [Halomonas populi]
MLLIALFTLLAAGIVKGAIGSGVPVLVIPVLTMLYDVKLAIAVLVAPNLFSNIVQIWQYRRHLLPTRFLITFSLAGALGIIVGTWGLVVLSPELLSLGVAGAIIIYLMIKLTNRQFTLSYATASRIVIPVGFLGGILQGAAGMSAPASITFLNAMRLERPVFIASISVFFVAITCVQIPALLSTGILTMQRSLFSIVALLIILLTMPLGSRLGKRLPHHWFDNLIMLLLAGISLKIITDALLT